ncbi:hypothetical protein [Synechocystis sp. LKSZ1]|uniref:hypothetical protein n=1 Tax=Synechocystis sp. LKSZ1 TaxID=3144951 RepID=UPI00336BB093
MNQYSCQQAGGQNPFSRVYQQILAGIVMALGAWMLVESPATATQSFSCQGQMKNGWAYTAEFVNGRFTQIRWQRAGQPPQTTSLKFVKTNAQQQPIYTGAFQAATQVTLVDLSGGDVRPGSSISVSVEEWGTSKGQCGTVSSGNIPPSPSPGGQRFACRGQMKNGWAYTAEYADRRFTQIRWERPGQPPQITTLTRQGKNAQGQPLYRGSFQAATMITLLDLSRGNVKPGSQVSVGAEEWGWARGNCRRN